MVRYDVVWYDVVPYDVVRCGTVRDVDGTRCGTMWYDGPIVAFDFCSNLNGLTTWK